MVAENKLAFCWVIYNVLPLLDFTTWTLTFTALHLTLRTARSVRGPFRHVQVTPNGAAVSKY